MSLRPLLHCSGSGTDESDSASQKCGDDDEEVVGPGGEAERKKSVDSGDTEGSESTDENENKEVTPYFLRPKKETEPRQPGVTLDIGDPAPSAPQVLDVVVLGESR